MEKRGHCSSPPPRGNQILVGALIIHANVLYLVVLIPMLFAESSSARIELHAYQKRVLLNTYVTRTIETIVPNIKK